MTAPADLIVLCAGGHARVVIDILTRGGRTVAAVTDANAALHGTRLDGLAVIGGDEAVFARAPGEVVLVNALGNGSAKVGESGLGPRRALFQRFKDKGYAFAQVLSTDAMISPHVTLGEGCHVLTGAIIHPGSTVGANTIINTGAQLDHDNHIGAHCHVAPGAVLCGTVTVGDGAHIGAGAVVLQGVTVGAGAIVGAGAVVVRNVPAHGTVLGNPARLV
jgi:UDP-perosamine 4-acetyltransferase